MDAADNAITIRHPTENDWLSLYENQARISGTRRTGPQSKPGNGESPLKTFSLPKMSPIRRTPFRWGRRSFIARG